DGPVGRDGCKPLAIGTECEAADRPAVVRGERLLPSLLSQGPGIPDPDGPVIAGRDQPGPIPIEAHAADRATMAAKSEHLLTSLEVPELHGFVPSRRSQALSVRTEYRPP